MNQLQYIEFIKVIKYLFPQFYKMEIKELSPMLLRGYVPIGLFFSIGESFTMNVHPGMDDDSFIFTIITNTNPSAIKYRFEAHEILEPITLQRLWRDFLKKKGLIH
jgi:hypothetical protein